MFMAGVASDQNWRAPALNPKKPSAERTTTARKRRSFCLQTAHVFSVGTGLFLVFLSALTQALRPALAVSDEALSEGHGSGRTLLLMGLGCIALGVFLAVYRAFTEV